MASTQIYDYICAIDFEATCVEGTGKEFYPHEIIEFPAIIIDTNVCGIISTFHSFVRPVINPKLSEFCKNLTGISQVCVDNADTFPYVLRKFTDWINETLQAEKTFVILTDGSWDINKFLSLQCCISEMDFPSWANHWIDIKRSFLHYNKGADKTRLTDMLHTYSLKFDGRLHSGKDDTYNIAQLVLAMLRAGCELVANSSLSSASSKFLKRKMAVYLRDTKKGRIRRKKPVQKGIIQPRHSLDVDDEPAMDIDPDLIGCESVLLQHKKK